MNDTTCIRPHPNKLTTLPDILSSLASLEDEENKLSSSLAAVLSDEAPLQISFSTLQSLAPRLDEIIADAELLSNTIIATARTAERVGGRVGFLDEEMRRVKEAGERVSQVMELKVTLADLRSSIELQDWEAATRLCARAMALPPEVISGPFAETAVPSTDSPLPPEQTLQMYREHLRDIFLHHFAQASSTRDASMTTRFFKLLPPIGWEKEGLEAYASFVLTLVHTKSPASAKSSSPLYYVTALTALFESVCSILDQHQTIVEKYYGKGKMQTVVEYLIHECDKVVKRLLDGWEEDRLKRFKIAEIAMTTSSTSIEASSVRKVVTHISAVDERDVDPRDVDKVLNEVAAMTMRYTAFRRFLYIYLQNNSSDDDGDGQASSTSRRDVPEPANDVQVIDGSACNEMFEDLVTKYYVPLEVWYLRFTTDQAFKTSVTDHSQVPPASTVPDLVFYILKTVLSRLINTGSVGAVESTIRQIREVIENDYAGSIKRRLGDVYKSSSTAPSVARVEKTEKEKRLGFIVLLNDLDISSLHLERLVKDLLSSQMLSHNFLGKEINSVHTGVTSLLDLANKFRSLLKAGIDQLFNQLTRPRLRTLIPEIYRDVTYVLDEEGYTASEYNDTVRKRFLKAWENLVEGFKDAFTENSYRIFIGQVIDVLIRPWEKYVMALKYTELGAIRFDQDIRAISTYLSSQVTFGDIRGKFQRLQQMSTLLNIDKDEDVEEFFSSSGIIWKLSMVEARAITALKI